MAAKQLSRHFWHPFNTSELRGYDRCQGSFPVPGPGAVELRFDNYFSMLRSKTVLFRFQGGIPLPQTSPEVDGLD